MKKLMEKIFGAKIHAKHTAIKGRKSGGVRDSNGVDWLKQEGNVRNPN